VEFEYLLAQGMRHFGDYFFRPRCQDCYRCIPIRVRTDQFKPILTSTSLQELKARFWFRVGLN
jgi:arginine-tRNA-protein transferase